MGVHALINEFISHDMSMGMHALIYEFISHDMSMGMHACMSSTKVLQRLFPFVRTRM